MYVGVGESDRGDSIGGEVALISDGGGDGIFFGLVGHKNALIFADDEETRSYSSIMLIRSSSDLIETRASRSSVGN